MATDSPNGFPVFEAIKTDFEETEALIMSGKTINSLDAKLLST